MKRHAVLVVLWTTIASLQAQNPVDNDCLGAIPVCRQVYQVNQAPVGFGNAQEINAAFNCIPAEINSTWYRFTPQRNGKFGFLLTPDNALSDYDWSIFDITDFSCEEISTNRDLLVSCNASGNTGCRGPTGATGDTGFLIQGQNCGEDPPNILEGFSPLNDRIDVEAGRTYVLLINIFSGDGGYELDFGLSDDIGIFDEVPPAMIDVNFAQACNGRFLTIEFSEEIQCPTLAADNFVLSGPGSPYTLTLGSVDCNAGAEFTTEFVLEVSPPINDPGMFTLDLQVDELTEALDRCDNPAAANAISFTGIEDSGFVELGPDTSLCDGQQLVLDAGTATGNYLWSDGSNGPSLTVTTSGSYAVTVVSACGEITDQVEVTFSPSAPPNITLGDDLVLCPGETIPLDVTTNGAAYLWQDGSTEPGFTVTEAGTYSVTVTTSCGQAEDDLQVTLPVPISASLDDREICPGESFTWDVTTEGADYLWQDQSVNPTFTVDAPGNYAVTITTACETRELSAAVQASAGALPPVDLGADTVLCPGTSLVFDFTGLAGTAFQWQDGATGASYTVTEPGTYSVVATNDCGETTDEVIVGAAEPITATLDGGAICAGESLNWDVSTPGGSYLWQDGSTSPAFTATEPGDYAVTITTGCDTALLSAEVTAFGDVLPEVNLGQDTSLCVGEELLLSIEEVAGAAIEWQDGSTGTSLSVTQPGTYARVRQQCMRTGIG